MSYGHRKGDLVRVWLLAFGRLVPSTCSVLCFATHETEDTEDVAKSDAAELAPAIMKSPAAAQASLTILGGNLDRHKSSWLANQAMRGVFGDTFVVCGDALLASLFDLLPPHRVAAFSLRGCCCCGGGNHEIVASLREIVRRQDRVSEPFNRIVLASGGESDLGKIARSIQNDPVLSHHLFVSEIVVMLSASEDLTRLQEDPLLAAQIESADCVVVIDGGEPPSGQIDSLDGAIRALRPEIPIYRPDANTTHESTAHI